MEGINQARGERLKKHLVEMVDWLGNVLGVGGGVVTREKGEGETKEEKTRSYGRWGEYP